MLNREDKSVMNKGMLLRSASSRTRGVSAGRAGRAGEALAVAAASAMTLLASTAAWGAPPVRVSQPWFRYLLSSIPAGGYMTLRNTTAKPIALTGASSPGCGMMMLHRTVHSHGQERMVPVKRITIPAQGTFRFVPGAYHVMCMKPRMHVGENVPVKLRFDRAPTLTVKFRVYGAMGKPSAH